MTENAIVFKGTKDGLYIILKDDADFETIKAHLDRKIKPSRKFFEGAKIVNIKGKRLSLVEYDEIKSILQDDYNMTVTGRYDEVSQDVIVEMDDGKEKLTYTKLPYEDIIEGRCLILRATIRSGQLIEYKGNVIIIGDVNPGAYIKADGSITVMGNLRGLAHAGINGDYSSFIVAFRIMANQLRIGDIIARAPEDMLYNSADPEIAIVKQGNITVQPYLPGK